MLKAYEAKLNTILTEEFDLLEMWIPTHMQVKLCKCEMAIFSDKIFYNFMFG